MRDLSFRIVGDVINVETIAAGNSIRSLAHLRERYGGKHWRKLKGIATVELSDGSQARAEIPWYESHGVGRRKLKIKHFVE